jgi:hypothetical protein
VNCGITDATLVEDFTAASVSWDARGFFLPKLLAAARSMDLQIARADDCRISRAVSDLQHNGGARGDAQVEHVTSAVLVSRRRNRIPLLLSFLFLCLCLILSFVKSCKRTPAEC